MSRIIRVTRPLLALAALAYGALVMTHADALRAAGVTGKAPQNAGAIQTFVSTLTDNFLWIAGTVVALAIVVVGMLFFFAHSRAADVAMKVALGAAVMVAAPGLAA